MVDKEVREATKAVLLEMFDNDPVALLDYIFKGGVLDVNKCRIAIIKRYYYGLCNDGLTACEAKQRTAEKFFRSVSTIENLIYNSFYKDIRI